MPTAAPTSTRLRPRSIRRPSRAAWFVFLTAGLAACGGDEGVTDPAPDEPTDPCLSLPAIAVGQSLGGTLSTTDCRLGGQYVDLWELDLPGTTRVLVDLTSDSFDPTLEIRDPNGTMVAFNDDWGGLNSRIIQELPAGRYRVLVRSFDPAGTGSYRLSVAPGPDCSDVAALSRGSQVEGSLQSGDCLLQFGGLVDWYGLDVDETLKFRIDVSSAFDELVVVADDEGNIIDGSAWDHPAGHARLERMLPVGSWRVGVTAMSEDQRGAYTLSVAEAPPCGPGGDLTLGETRQGTISGEDCLLDGWAFADSVGLVLDTPTDLHIQAKSVDPYPLVIVRDETGLDVAVAYAETQGVAETRTRLPAGRYAVHVVLAEIPGDYSLTVSEIVCNEAGSFAFGESVEGTLDFQDCARDQGQLQDTWAFSVEEETSVRFDLRSSEFDAFLVVLDAEGNEIGTDDDGGTGTDSRLDVTLSAGTYRVVASTYAPGQSGNYVLSATAPPASAPPTTAATPSTAKPSVNAPPQPLRWWERLRGDGVRLPRSGVGKR